MHKQTATIKTMIEESSVNLRQISRFYIARGSGNGDISRLVAEMARYRIVLESCKTMVTESVLVALHVLQQRLVS